MYDPIETLAYVAARTSRITLGTSVLDALFQSPVVLARRLATLDRLSDGRLVAGIGQGWMEQEFAAAGVSMKRRGAGFEEHLLAMRRSGVPTRCSFDGPLLPHPRGRHRPQAGPPGRPAPAGGRRVAAAVERAGRLGVGLTLVIFDWDTVRESGQDLPGGRRAAGHDPDTLPVMLQVNGNVTEEPLDERGPLLGSPEQVAADLERAAKLGVEHVYWNSDGDPRGSSRSWPGSAGADPPRPTLRRRPPQRDPSALSAARHARS